MITIIGVWEPTWMEPKVERRVWKQTLDSYKVNAWHMVGGSKPNWAIPTHHDSFEEALNLVKGKKTFLIAPDRIPSESLKDYSHPEDAIYVFGNTPDNLVRFVTEEDDVVSIHTPHNATMFGHCVLPTVLYDRQIKHGY